MKAYRQSRGTELLVLNIGARWRCVVNILLQQLYPQERTSVPLQYKAVWGPKAACVFWRRVMLYM
jgi:hypothetical protein